MTSKHLLSFVRLGVVAGLITLSAGCTSIGKLPGLSMFEKKLPASTPQDPVIDVIALWQPTEGKGLDDLPTRGFAGQLLFMTRGQKTPVRVDGDVSVYVYDDHGTHEEQVKPLHVFNFKEGAFDKYLYDTNVGPSYYMFIPYTRKSPEEANCSLRVKFEPKNGQPTFSEMASISLAGTARKEKDPRSDDKDEQIAELKRQIQTLAAKKKKSGPVQRIDSIGHVGKRGDIVPASAEASEKPRFQVKNATLADLPDIDDVAAEDTASARFRRLHDAMNRSLEQTSKTETPIDVDEAPRSRVTTATTRPRRFKLRSSRQERHEEQRAPAETPQTSVRRHPLDRAPAFQEEPAERFAERPRVHPLSRRSIDREAFSPAEPANESFPSDPFGDADAVDESELVPFGR